MNSKNIILALDTSNYTTSLALMYDDGELLANIKRPLQVKSGECGLRQSDAVFAHVKNIPLVMNEARMILDGRHPVAVGVSAVPRNIEGSYMPCFLTGVATAESISSALDIPIFKFSHQCGHIMAALYSSGMSGMADGSFAALHISGGTTELLQVNGDNKGFVTKLVGGTKDLNAGQVIDRVGVRLGMPFPAGAYMERAALENTDNIPKRKISVDGTHFNLSGLENIAIKMYESSGNKCLTAAFVFEYIANSISQICENYIKEYGDTPFVFAGGVMCNSIIKNKLREKFTAYFAEPVMSADNAVGIAALTRRAFLS